MTQYYTPSTLTFFHKVIKATSTHHITHDAVDRTTLGNCHFCLSDGTITIDINTTTTQKMQNANTFVPAFDRHFNKFFVVTLKPRCHHDTITVPNTGNQTLTGVTVSDPFISDLTLVASAATADGELDVGETWSYTATHVVLQSEIDAGGDIVNLAMADSDQTGPDTDGASIPVEQTPGLNITKDAAVAGGTANAAGEVISYTIAVQNTGNQTLTGVTVSDPFISDLTLVDSAATADGELDVGETWSYTATHTVTQAEIDAGDNIVNVATADSSQTGPDTDDAFVPVAQMPGLNIVKDASVAGGTADAAGEIISYNISVQNTGNQTLTGVTVVDPQGLIIEANPAFCTMMACTAAELLQRRQVDEFGRCHEALAAQPHHQRLRIGELPGLGQARFWRQRLVVPLEQRVEHRVELHMVVARSAGHRVERRRVGGRCHLEHAAFARRLARAARPRPAGRRLRWG